jgi:phage replication-related protein YjqB (UPF0714/DUF867 family)
VNDPYHAQNPAEQDPGTSPFDVLGLKRSRGGKGLTAKIIHAASARVDVVGIHVENVEQCVSELATACSG